MERQRRGSAVRGSQSWIGLACCAAMLVCWVVQQLVPNQPDEVQVAAGPVWLPLLAAAVGAVAVLPLAIYEGEPKDALRAFLAEIGRRWHAGLATLPLSALQATTSLRGLTGGL